MVTDLVPVNRSSTQIASNPPFAPRDSYNRGFSIDEAADLLGISRTTAKRYWAYARAWLLAELYDTDAGKDS